MNDIGWLFPLVLFVALLASGIMMFFQQKRYVAAVHEAAAQSIGPDDALVTGRGRGLTRGAVAVLLVDRSTRTITHAQAMCGATVFARFTPHPELLGDLKTAPSRVRGKHLAKAIEAALDQLPSATPPDARETVLARAREARRAAHAEAIRTSSNTSDAPA